MSQKFLLWYHSTVGQRLALSCMKGKKIRCSIGVLLVFLVAVAVYVNPIARDVRHAEHHKRELEVAPDLREVGAACVSLLQSSPEDEIFPIANDSRLPPALRCKNPRLVSIDRYDHTVIVEFAGGFIHYGYRWSGYLWMRQVEAADLWGRAE